MMAFFIIRILSPYKEPDMLRGARIKPTDIFSALEQAW